MTQDDLLYRFRLWVFAMAGELGNLRAACRATGIHPSTSDRWKHQLDRYGPEILRPRERRTPRMANQTSVLVEQCPGSRADVVSGTGSYVGSRASMITPGRHLRSKA